MGAKALDSPLEESGELLAFARTERAHHGLEYAMSLLGWVVAAALGLGGLPFLGYTAGVFFALVPMLTSNEAGTGQPPEAECEVATPAPKDARRADR